MLQKVVCTLLVPVILMKVNAYSPPGEPTVTHCRSYEKETFTCWWKPGSDGGLPTNYTLLYWTEKNKTQVECPDYHTSGPNSCYFSKAHFSIWRYYFVTVNATNALGWNASELIHFEIVDIVQPYPPRNLSFSYEGNESNVPYLLVKWNRPEKADVKVGWMTVEYEVRLREEKKQTWEEHRVEQQTKLKVFSLTPGKNYVVQVRCKADTGKWSEWSEEGYVQIPGVTKKHDLTLWVSIAVLSVIICLTMIWTMVLKGYSWMSCICPPVPGPKIMGFDTQLLKSGKSEDLLGALGCQGFPPTSDCEDLLVEFLEVDDSKEHLMSSPEKELQCQHIKVSPVDTDNDSGRGSCDSHFVPSEEIKDQRVQSQGVESIPSGVRDHLALKSPWPLQSKAMDQPFSNLNYNKSSDWSDDKTSSNQSPKSTYHNFPDVCKLALSVMNANMSKFAMPQEDKRQDMYFQTIENIHEGHSNKQSDLGDLHSKGVVEADMLSLLLNEKMPSRTMDYVEVHKVNQNSALALIPKHKENNIITDQYSMLVPDQEYSKVERVEADNALVLMQNLELQVSPLSGGNVMKEFIQKPQQSQAEKLMGFIKPVINEGEMTKLGMGYMDPSSFFP
ncbi:prolactin receptor [Hyla sarda]|uniref:prolactin receptor n=1 Tax=Hyla sarda TaxID=327740 RepID=UPI0024C3F227|nr:prolactin receptor [Hyla sarda]XP_056402659.1 prolactin receptor [Hyla sarda]